MTRKERVVHVRWRSHLGTLVWVLMVLAGAHVWHTRDVPSGPAPGFEALAVSAQDGALLSLAQWRTAHPGQPVALHFWAEWCPVCKLEQGNITAVAADWPVLTVAMRSGDVAAVRRVLAQRALAWPTVVDADGAVAARYGLHAVPAFVVIDPAGRLRASSVGYTTEIGMRLRLWWAGL
jgi:thiol-disulfide isomerase/thioredoxin